MADKFCKFKKQKRQVSYDNGVTWQDVIPIQTQKGDLIERDSQQCGYVPVIEPIYDWFNMDSMTDFYCDGTTKYYKQIYKQSVDNGVTWTVVQPIQYRKGDVAQVESVACGYEPPSYDTNVFTFSDGTVYKNPTRTSDAGTYEISLISTYNDSPVGYTVSENCAWIDDSYTATSTSFKFSYTKNTSSTSRTCRITLYQQYTYATLTIEITQNGQGSTGETYMYWNIANHYDTYSATIPWNQGVTLETFSSLVNGSATNAVISANQSWVVTSSPMYYNNNEFRPNVNTQIVQVEANNTSSDRSAVVTFTQNGTSNNIKLNLTQTAYVPDCTITAFTMSESEVCKGDAIPYTMRVGDTACTENFTFTMWDSARQNSVTSSVKPTNGVGNGSFATSRLGLGNATCSVSINGRLETYTVNVKDCTPEPPQPTTMNLNFTVKNATSNVIYIDWIDIITSSGTRSVSLGSPITIGQNRWSDTITKTVTIDWNGETINSIMARDTTTVHCAYSGTFTGDSTLKDGGTYNITLNTKVG